MIVVKRVDVTKPMGNGVDGFLALFILWSIFDIENSVWSSNALNFVFESIKNHRWIERFFILFTVQHCNFKHSKLCTHFYSQRFFSHRFVLKSNKSNRRKMHKTYKTVEQMLTAQSPMGISQNEVRTALKQKESKWTESQEKLSEKIRLQVYLSLMPIKSIFRA